MDQLNLNVGDLVLYNDKLYPIVELLTDGVIIETDLVIGKFIDCDDLASRKFEHCVKFWKNQITGESHATTEEGALREKALLDSIGWETKMYKREVVVKSF